MDARDQQLDLHRHLFLESVSSSAVFKALQLIQCCRLAPLVLPDRFGDD